MENFQNEREKLQKLSYDPSHNSLSNSKLEKQSSLFSLSVREYKKKM